MDQHHSHSHFVHHHNHQHHNHHQRTRYAPLPPPPHHHHHHQQQQVPPPPRPPPSLPPPPQPQPQPLSYRTIHTLPPPPYNNNNPPLHQSQFPFNPANYPHHHRPLQEERQISSNHIQAFSQSPRISSRIILPDDPLPRRNLPNFDQETAWNPSPRIVPDNGPQRNYPPLDLDRELRHRSIDRDTPLPPPPPIRYDPEGGSSRLRREYEGKPREEGFGWGRGGGDANYHHHHRRAADLAPSLDSPNRCFGLAPVMSREIGVVDSKPRGYVRVHDAEFEGEVFRGGRRDGHSESKRWVNERKGPRELFDSPFELGDKNIGSAGNGDDFRIMSSSSAKREYYGSELGSYSGRGNSRECGHEFSRTLPKKQIQKKSALLRIQTVKPSYRNREIEQSRYAGYAADSNSNFFRGKEQHGYVGHGSKAEDKEGSPVELDISFESNSLVAKAIVAPSNSAIVSDTNMTSVSDTDLTSSEDRKKALVSDSDCSGLKPARVCTSAVNLNGLPCKANDSSSCVKDMSLQKNVLDSCSEPCTSVSGNSHGKNEVVLSEENTKICSGKSSPRVVKKKKIVKRVVKKVVVNPNSTASNLRSANTVHGSAQADSVTRGSSTISDPDKVEPYLKQENITLDKVSLPGSSYNLPKEGNVFPEDKKGGLSLLSLSPHSRSQECKIDEDSDTGKVVRFERGQNISNSTSFVSSSEDKKSDADCLDADNSVHNMLSVPNADMVAKSLNGSTSEINHIDYDYNQLCQNQESLSPERYSNLGCPENRFVIDVGDEMNCRLFSSADNIVNSDLINTCNAASDRVDGLNSSDLTGSKEKFAVTDIGHNGVVGKTRENEDPAITKYAILEENPDTVIPVSSSVMFASSSSVKTSIQAGPDFLQNASVLKQGSDNGPANLEVGTCVHHSHITDHAAKQVSPSDATISSENCHTVEMFPNSNISVGFGEGDRNKMKKRKIRTHSKMEGISPKPVNSVSLPNLLLNNPFPLEVIDQSVQSLNFNSESCLDGFITLHGKRGLLEGEFFVGDSEIDDANKVSPVSKRVKVSTTHPKFTHCHSEFNDAIVVSTSGAKVPISFSDKPTHQEEDGLSSMDILGTAQSKPYTEDIPKLSGNILVGGSCESMDANRETMSSEHLELKHPDIVPNSLCEDSDIPNVQFSMLDGEQKENGTPIVSINNTQSDILVIVNTKGEKTDLQPVKEKYWHKGFVQGSPAADVESNDPNVKDDLIPQQNFMSSSANGDGVISSNSNGELIEDAPELLSDMCSQEITSEAPDRSNLDGTATHKENICRDKENLDVSAVEHGSDLLTFTSSIQNTTKVLKSDHATGHSNPIIRNLIPQPSHVYSKNTTQGLKSYFSENGSKNELGGIAKTYKGHSFTISKTKAPSSSTHISKPRTWHRSVGNFPTPAIKPSTGTFSSKRPILEKKGNIQNTSYIRKGNNSLVRQPTTVSALPQIPSANQSPLGLDELPKSTVSESRVDVTDQPAFTNASQQRQMTTPPLPIDIRSEENLSSPLVEPPSIGCCENALVPRKLIETNDATNSSEDSLKHYETPDNQTSPPSNGESQVEANEGNISSSNTKRIVYIKPKTNQLVATSNSCDVSVSTDGKSQTAFSDGYYKRSKNQLVRTTFESHINQIVTMPNTTVDSDGQGSCKDLCNRRFSKRRSHKVAGSSCKPLRASLVWTLCGKNSLKNCHGSWHYQKVLPHIFPWKRAMYLRSFINNSASSSNSSSSSTVSKKLLLLRKMDTLYTRSTRGFSLWKSKVLGVGGSSLKWSKSIEKHSKQANEEATLAVAAVERKKREQKDAACIGSEAKRERIFRIGLVRYKMDPSRRTLQRISDDESMSSATVHSGLTAKRAYIPRRLVIGNDEYVRIGNGNQLIRDPKKRTRKLANEKVRWSLHTARQRLARKQKYCQFFTRFGKCNKEGGKCPYIHDPSKIAVCTKFLNGLCSTANCKLTHKVIPERMPDCSYFLQGLCTNRNCPYRHVNVNPKASICEGFLKGYCADGNECRKKHSYVCPTFEATGTCAQGTKCKLHHPKKQKGKKRKRSGDQNNSRGRYFGSVPIDVSQPGMMVAPRQHEQKDDLEGELSDYISLDVDEEVADTADQSLEQALGDSDTLDLQIYNYDEHIKPILIMKTKWRETESICK